MYEIYGYSNVDSLFGIFNAVAAISGASDYLDSIKVVIAIGFLVALLITAFNLQHSHGWKWIAGVFLIFNIMFVPKVEVAIIDKLGYQAPQVVSNVPFGLALFGHVTSKLGDVLTGLFETAFQVIPGPSGLPPELSYQGNGVMFASKLVKRSRGATFSDLQLQNDIIQFIQNCTMYDLADGTIDQTLFNEDLNVWVTMGGTNVARFTPIGSPTAIVGCRAAWLDLDMRKNADMVKMEEQMAREIFPGVSLASSVPRLQAALPASYAKSQIAVASSTATDMLLQNAMINAFHQSVALQTAGGNDPSGTIVGMGVAQATAQINSSYMVQAKVTEEALPLIRNLIEGLLYAVFPLMFLLILVMQGKAMMVAVKGYIFALIWIQLWPPLYAVINYFQTNAVAKHLEAAASLAAGGTGMTLATASPIYSNAISDLAVSGYMVLAIIPISWALLKGMDSVGQAAITGLSTIQGISSSVGSQVATGSASWGGLSFQQQNLSPNRTSPDVYSEQRLDSDGRLRTHTLGVDSGYHSFATQTNSPIVRSPTSVGSSAHTATESSKSYEVGAEKAEQASIGITGAAATTWSFVSSKGNHKAFSSGSGLSTDAADEQGFSRDFSVVEGISEKTGVGRERVAQLYLNASVGTGKGAAALDEWERGNQDIKAQQKSGTISSGEAADKFAKHRSGLKSVLKGVGIDVGEQDTETARYAEAIDRVYDYRNAESSRRAHRFVQSVATNERFVEDVVSDQKRAKEVSDQVREARENVLRAGVFFREGDRLSHTSGQRDDSNIQVQYDPLSDSRYTDLALRLEREYPGAGPEQRRVISQTIASEYGFAQPQTYLDGSIPIRTRSGLDKAYEDRSANLDPGALSKDQRVDVTEYVEGKRHEQGITSFESPGEASPRSGFESEVQARKEEERLAAEAKDWTRDQLNRENERKLKHSLTAEQPPSERARETLGRSTLNGVKNFFGIDGSKRKSDSDDQE